jgi:hypothetical protein
MGAARPLSVEILLDIVKREAARREGKPLGALQQGNAQAAHLVAGFAADASLLPTYLLGTPRRHVRDFLPLWGEEFVSEAFTTLLWRAPDSGAREAYLTALACGRANRWEVLLRIRWSAEGRRRGIKVRGLIAAAAFSMAFRVPIVGFVLNAASNLLALPLYLRDSRQSDTLAFALLRSLGR